MTVTGGSAGAAQPHADTMIEKSPLEVDRTGGAYLRRRGASLRLDVGRADAQDIPETRGASERGAEPPPCAVQE